MDERLGLMQQRDGLNWLNIVYSECVCLCVCVIGCEAWPDAVMGHDLGRIKGLAL